LKSLSFTFIVPNPHVVEKAVWAQPLGTVLPEAWSRASTVSRFGCIAYCARFGSSPLPPQTKKVQNTTNASKPFVV